MSFDQILQNELELSNINSTLACFGPHDRIAGCKNPSCSTEKSQLNAKYFQQEENLRTVHPACEAPVSALCVNIARFFSKFKKTFTAAELKQLREVGPNKTEDSTFVHNAVKFLYKSDFEKLLLVSLTGRSTKKEKQKEKMSPEYYDVVKNLFRTRLISLSLHAEEFMIHQ